jgi:hypothetical protein
MSAISTADGSVITPDNNGWVTLTAGTYVFVLRTSDQIVESMNIATDATIAFSSMIFETTNAGRSSGGQTVPGTVTDWDASVDTTWVQENPPTAYIATAGTGWTATAASLVKTAGKGAAMVQFEDVGAMRLRSKVVVTTGGTMRVSPWGKS